MCVRVSYGSAVVYQGYEQFGVKGVWDDCFGFKSLICYILLVVFLCFSFVFGIVCKRELNKIYIVFFLMLF